MSDEPILTFEEHGPIVLCRIQATSVLDARNVEVFGKALMARAEQSPGAHILIDFSQVNYLTSAVLNELLKVHRKLLETNGDLRLCSINQDIRKIFEITNLDKVFIIYDFWKEGIKKYQRSLELEAQDRSWRDIRKE